MSKYYQEDFFIYSEIKIPYYVKKELVEEKKESDKRRLRMSTIFNTEEGAEQTFDI